MNEFMSTKVQIPKLKKIDLCDYLTIFHPTFLAQSTMVMVGKKMKKMIFAYKVLFLNTMTFSKDHVGIHFASRLGSNCAHRKGKSLGARDILKWPK